MEPKDLCHRYIRKNWVELAESPLPVSPKSKAVDLASTSGKGLSPISVLAHDLSSANINDVGNLKRRLSLCSQSGSPSPSKTNLKSLLDNHAGKSSCDTPRSHCSQKMDPGTADKENSGMKSILLPKDLPKNSIPLLEQQLDQNSRDSVLDDPASFKFAQPSTKTLSRSTPQKENCLSPSSPRGRGTKLFRCLSSGSESIDDGFMDILSMEKEDISDLQNAPSGIGSLLSGQIKHWGPITNQVSPANSRANAKRSLHRSLSVNDFDSPVTSRIFPPDVLPSSMDTSSRAFKRPEPISENSGQPSAKKKRNFSPSKPFQALVSSSSCGASPLLPSRAALTQSSLLNYGFQKNKPLGPCKFQRSLSDTDAIIKNSVERSCVDSLLVGDFSRSFVLPLMNGKHTDLKTISCETLATLMKGEYETTIDSVSVIDCRYPYEFVGGHIGGAKNLFTRDLINDVFINGSQGQPPSLSVNKKHVLIFHCEFSSERGPGMLRYLRNLDRQMNKECYPQLFYPEMYILNGGYKAFFKAFPELCEPRDYVPMLSQGNEADLRHFRAKSRSWAGDVRTTSRMLPSNFTLKRLDV